MSPKAAGNCQPNLIRVSLGSAIVFKLLDGKLDSAPTTAYVMTYRERKCSANCGFCPQARASSSRADMLSRVSWPAFATENVIDRLREAAKSGIIKRVCIQALNYPEVFMHLQALAETIREETKVPISVSCQPKNAESIRCLAVGGVERIGIPVDAATETLFDRIKGASAAGPYEWERQFELLAEAVNVFGKGKVSTHLIVGLGETEEDIVNAIQKCVDMGVLPALFAFTPIAGTKLERKPQPAIQTYRRLQIARILILQGTARHENMRFDKEGKLIDFGVDHHALTRIIETGEPFLTSGCPNCNRPYYNEKPSGPIYNFPRQLTKKELSDIQKQLSLDGA